MRTTTAGLVAWLVILLVAAATAEAQVQNKDQQKCINGLNKDFNKVVQAQGKALCDCIKNHAKGKLVGTPNECFADPDVKGKVQKAKDKTQQDFDKFCVGLNKKGETKEPDFGISSVAVANQFGMEKDVILFERLFGSDLDASLIPEAADKDASKCQQAIAKSVKKCQDTKLKEFELCKKSALKNGASGAAALEACVLADPKGKIAKACNEKLTKDMQKQCADKGVDLATAFPGCNASTVAALHDCIEPEIECAVCLALNAVDDLDADCDLLDDGASNQSCPTTFLGWTGIPMGTILTQFDNDMFCVGGVRDGLPCTDVISHQDCQPRPPTARCLMDSFFELQTFGSANQPTLTLPLAGESYQDCGPVDPQTGEAECFAAVDFVEGFPITVIGQVCFDVFPGCPAGFFDCDGGRPADLELFTDHNIGDCGLGDDPNNLDSGTGNQDCELLCDNYCANLAGGGWTQSYALCESYCEAGPRGGLRCSVDAQCPDSACAGGQPVAHANKCQCHCRRTVGAGGPPGTVISITKTGLTIESDAPCDKLDITQAGTPRCGPSSTETSSTEFININNVDGQTLTVPTSVGTPSDCNLAYVDDPSTGARLVGNTNFVDTGLGDDISTTKAKTESRSLP